MHKPSVVVVVAVLFASQAGRADSYIEAQCQATPEGGICNFTNSGSDAGSGCANVTLTQTTGGGTTKAAPACSGLLAPSEKRVVALTFVGPKPAALCVAAEAPTEFRCTMAVVMSDVTAESGPLSGLFFPLLILLSSIGVFIDAKRIGARKGLIGGIADIGPGGWLVCCLLLWIVAFPLYLVKRGSIAAAAKAAPKT